MASSANRFEVNAANFAGSKSAQAALASTHCAGSRTGHNVARAVAERTISLPMHIALGTRTEST